jgi:ribokinase
MEKVNKKITVCGGANYDTFIIVDRLPEIGETICAPKLAKAPGGKGENSAAAIGKLGHAVDFVGQLGNDASGGELIKAMKSCNVNTDYIKYLDGSHTGEAFIFSYPNKNNSIIVVGGANMNWEKNDLSQLKESLKTSQILLLQREIPEEINIQAAKLAKSHSIKVILDAGGEDKELPKEFISNVDIISPNETELKRLTGKTIDIHKDEEIISELKHLQEISGNKELSLLLKLGSKGCAWVDNNGVKRQAALHFDDIPIVDTTGAGDCFTGAFATKYLEGCDIQESLKYASAAAYLCISKFGALPAMPLKADVDELLKRS